MGDRQTSPGSTSTAVGELDHRHLWHPFTQQRDWCAEAALVIAGAEGTDLIDADGRRYIDGVSSLWCNVHGHRHPLIDEALHDQVDRVAHSTMLGLTHQARPSWRRAWSSWHPGLGRVFYSDSGSSATEIALKMAFQYWQQLGGQHRRRTSFVCLLTPTTATPWGRSRSAASTSSTRPTLPSCSRPPVEPETPPSSSACSRSTPRRSRP